MYIKCFDLYGFRTYFERSVINLHPGLEILLDNKTSDLFTALRWALMDNRLNALGCRKLEELIFAGDNEHVALNFTEVNIEFDNTKKKLPVDWFSVNIKRRYFRTRESEFCLNWMPCRLKDIRELLSDILNVDGVAVWGIADRFSFTDLSSTLRRRLWDASADCMKYRKQLQVLGTKHKVAKENQDRMNNLIEELLLQLQDTKIGKLLIFSENEEIRLEERLKFLQDLQSEQFATIEKLNREILNFKETLSNQFEEDFSRLSAAFLYEIQRWTNWNASLVLTQPNDLESTGIAIEGLPDNLTISDQSAMGWAFWSACMKVLELPVSVIQVNSDEEPHMELLLAVLSEFAPSMQIIMCKR
ncbi:hypothetical protein [Paenibacillus sp. Leaf72]|uniref:hypothetical protein n=1 Tax=Paenibacillus sp. Leaf72 TaxID=1736234 RepID=UPI0006F4E229|nr:hypothetical protein [Paenibacillus sp. Leaf72]KQN96777.1 hypothetical protein ASF12_22145 [Paenibacillus sp. Leaf72]